MLAARRKIREQLRQTGGLIRWTDAIASPTEFYTLTVWENKHVMFNFMSSDAHREMMWMFTRWSDEFWSMRWTPGEREAGSWQGLHLACPSNSVSPPRPPAPTPQTVQAVRTGAGGVDPSWCRVTAVIARVRVRHPKTMMGLLDVRRRLRATVNGRLLRWAMGSIELDHYLLLSLWETPDRADPAPWSDLVAQLPDAWVMEWQPGDYEIGHWNRLRLRQFAWEAQRRSHLAHHLSVV